MAGQRKIRIGIDVGGTFTHAVAIDAATLALVGRSKVPTTHTAAEGVARGVVESLQEILRRCAIAPDEIVLIAHSTTQATNALLEGDVAPVGIVGMGGGTGAWLARRQTALPSIALAPGRHLAISQRFIRSERVSETTVAAALDQLCRAGAQVIVAAEAVSVDDPRHEELVCAVAARRGLPATATHHVSRLHGLGVRTRTAVINASMIPRMLNTAELTERAVRAAGITAPLMIMRSDGGVMDIAEMRRRPILTMLSGPAAGVAAALLYARVSDGVFLEVGGTSTDISVIKNGRCQIRSAEIGGQKLHVSTLDVRTVGLAGGSLVQYWDGGIVDVGPRSAHIAGLSYVSFLPTRPESIMAPGPATDCSGALTVGVSPRRDFLCRAGDENTLPKAELIEAAVTPTCASNYLGLVPEGDPARGNQECIRPVFDLLAHVLKFKDGTALADAILRTAARKVTVLIQGLLRDYKLDPGVVRLIGGGGGASAIVPYVARVMGLPFETVENADVISAIGAALALVRDSVERTVIEPNEEDIRRIREEAFTSVLRMGAAAETVEVFVEVDAKRNLLRATAEGATEIRAQELRRAELSLAERGALVAASLGGDGQPAQRVLEAGGFEIWTARRVVHRLWKFLPEARQAVRVLDQAGTIRWASNHADVRGSTVALAERDLADFAETYTRYSDAGATIPRCYVLLSNRVIDLSGLVEIQQVLEVLRIELQRQAQATPCALLVDMGTS